MKIERASVDCLQPVTTGSFPSADLPTRPLELGPLPAGLTTAIADASDDGARVIGLLAETLYGVRAPRLGTLPGEVDVRSSQGRFRLRRRLENSGVRFTIASLDGQPAGNDTLAALLGAETGEAVARVFYSTPETHSDIGSLLSAEVAAELQTLAAPVAKVATTESRDWNELLHRRDQVTQEIETRLADRRRESQQLESQLTRLDAEVNDLRGKSEVIEKTLRGIETELAAVESNLRYQAIASETERAAAHREASDWRPRIDELEDQIQQWRTTLAELEAREAEVRSELSAIHPDDAEPSLPLADQRAGLAVARRLVEDLESEVARLARSSASDACVCKDAHPRMNPLVDTLGKQLARLASLAEQQERALHVQSLSAEAAHLSRTQEDLRRQIDHLITRRQTLWRTTRARPEEDLRAEVVEVSASDRVSLDQRRTELQHELSTLKQRLGELAIERESLLTRRSALLNDAPLEALQAELNELQARLQSPRVSTSVATTATPGRASEWFAKLVDGRYTGLRLMAGGRELMVIDPAGGERPAARLSRGERQLAAISLRLAVVGGFALREVHLPLLLEEPFAGLDSRESAILANVLDDFARMGHQVVVFTANPTALDRFRLLGTPVLKIGVPRVAEQTSVTTRRFEVEPPVASSRVVTQTVRSEYLLAPEDPIERFPVPIANREAVFARSRVRTIADLLSADPSALAEELDRDDVTAELASLWQTHTALVTFVPGMTFELASLLTSLDILDAGDLADANGDELYSRLVAWLESDAGRQFRNRGYSRSTVGGWISSAQRGRQRWRDSSAWDGWRRHRGERRQRVESNARRTRTSRQSNGRSNGSRSERSNGSTRSSHELRVRSNDSDVKRTTRKTRTTRSDQPKKREWRFYLETSSPVVDAPSIGPKMAERLKTAGVNTVAELLAADPIATASAIESKRVTDETIVAWQHQAQLVCRIPLLRGHDAQILVECGFTQPEEVAAMKPAELLEFVEPFCSTTEGQRILRNGQAPDLAEVTEWIEWARHSRLLEAA